MSTHLSRLDLGRCLLAGAERPADTLHLAGCDRCRQALADARADAQRFRAIVLPRTLPDLEARRARRPAWRWLATSGAAVAALAVAVLVARGALRRPGAGGGAGLVGPVGEGAAGDTLTAKGRPALQIFARRGEVVTPVHEGARLRAGDRLRFAVSAAERCFVSIASVDGRGAASVYYSSTPVAAGGVTALPDSIALDDAPGPERLFAVFSRAPIPDEQLVRALAAAAKSSPDGRAGLPVLPIPYSQISLTIDKEKAPR